MLNLFFILWCKKIWSAEKNPFWFSTFLIRPDFKKQNIFSAPIYKSDKSRLSVIAVGLRQQEPIHMPHHDLQLSAERTVRTINLTPHLYLHNEEISMQNSPPAQSSQLINHKPSTTATLCHAPWFQMCPHFCFKWAFPAPYEWMTLKTIMYAMEYPLLSLCSLSLLWFWKFW